MDGCKRIRIRELFKSMNVCRLQSVMKYDWITNLLQVCYWTPLEFNYFYSFTRVTLYYNLYRPYEVGSGDAYRQPVVITCTSPYDWISLAFCRAEHLPSSCSVTLSSSRTFCFLFSLISFLQVFHQPRIFHVALDP